MTRIIAAVSTALLVLATCTLMVLAALLVGLGLYPAAVLSITDASVRAVIPLPSAVAHIAGQPPVLSNRNQQEEQAR